MGFVYRKPYTTPVPASAEIIARDGRRQARWRLRNGRMQTAEVVEGSDGRLRIRGRSSVYTARFRDGGGRVVEVSTGCRDETAARQVLADWVKRSERVRAGLLTAAEDAAIGHSDVSISRHVSSYMTHLGNKRVRGRLVSTHHRRNVEHNLRRIIRECEFDRLSNVTRSAVERWLRQRESEGMSARTRNAHLAALVAFCNWSVQTHRMVANPLNRMSKASERADPRRKRRALTEQELVRLLEAARRRPILDAMTVRRGDRKGQAVARLSDNTRRSLEQLGWERSLIYKTLVLTGLRKKELASLTVGLLELTECGVSYVVLKPQDEKNGRGSEIPIRADLADDLRCWLASKLERAREEAQRSDEPIPATLPADTPLFQVPDGLIRIFDLDLVAAGIARRVKKNGRWVIDKRDDRGRTIDVHALRHTFGTHLSKGGVAPRTAQAAMRHSTLDLTMNIYTDPRLLDVAGALAVLPDLPLEPCERRASRDAAAGGGATPAVGISHPPADAARKADSTAVAAARLAPALALTGDLSGQSTSSPAESDVRDAARHRGGRERATVVRDASCALVSAESESSQKQRANGLEPSTFSLEG